MPKSASATTSASLSPQNALLNERFRKPLMTLLAFDFGNVFHQRFADLRGGFFGFFVAEFQQREDHERVVALEFLAGFLDLDGGRIGRPYSAAMVSAACCCRKFSMFMGDTVAILSSKIAIFARKRIASYVFCLPVPAKGGG